MPRLALPGAVLLALALVSAIAWGTRPGLTRAAMPGSQTAMVTSVTRSCPPAAPGAGATRIAMIAMPPQATTASPGSANSGAGNPGATGSGAVTPTGAARLSAVLAAPPANDKTVSGKASTSKASTGKSSGGKASPTGEPSPSATPGTPVKAGTSAKAITSAAKRTREMRPVTVSAPGTATTVTAPGGGGAAVAATGQMAEGFEAEQSNASGMGLVSCTHPSSDMWFVGTGQSAGASQIWLYLMNTGTLAASADLTILTDTGLQTGLSNAIAVAPNQFVKENITPFVEDSQAVALHVQTSSGQVAASVWEGSGTGGGAWLPQASAPATTLVIPGLTVASSSAKLFVTVPGSTDAKLTVVAYTPAGAVTQFPSTPVDASAGATTPLALNSLGASAAGLKLISNVPIVASVLVPGTGIGSFTTAVPPVTEQGVVAGNPATRGVTVGLLLTAPSAAAQASISVVSADGIVTVPVGDQAVTVAAGHTLAVSVPHPQGDRRPFAIIVTPQAGSGPLYAVRVVTQGTGGMSAPVASLLPVPSALTSITLPPVQNSYTAVLP
jgi:hypothetical protein